MSTSKLEFSTSLWYSLVDIKKVGDLYSLDFGSLLSIQLRLVKYAWLIMSF